MSKKYRTNQSLIDTGFRQTSGETLTLCGNTVIGNTAMLKYESDMSGTYTARSVVDAEYVTGVTSCISDIGSIGQIIYRGVSGITGATGFIYDSVTSGVTVSNLCISQTPVSEVGEYYFLTWDSGTTKVNKMPALSVTGIQSGINGLDVIGDCVCLGGELIDNTCIWGQSGSTISFCINNENSPIVIDNRCNGGIYLKSQCNTSSSYFDDFSDSVGFQINKCNGGFKIFDCRAGAEQKGIEYDGNYSSFYTARSLVDKTYVDTIASGLHPKQAVQAATTPASGNTILSGNTGTIDGISVSSIISSGNRILVKDQTNGAFNGIYSATTGTWGRTEDFDFDPITGEIVQGSYFFIMSGTNKNSTWVLTTPDIITSGDTLTFIEFNQVTDIDAGTGITITVYATGEHTISVDGPSLAGNSLSWNNTTHQFDVDIESGTLSTALDSKVDITEFTGYTATTQPIIDAAFTGATNGLTGIGNNVVLGGNLTGATNINISGQSLTITDISGAGIEYADNYSTTYSNRSLVDKQYVNDNITGNSNTIAVCNVTISTYTATTNNDFIGVSGTSVIYLPPIPKLCQRIIVSDICGNALSNNIIICGCWGINGQNINGDTFSIINTDYGSMTFINNGISWSAIGFIN